LVRPFPLGGEREENQRGRKKSRRKIVTRRLLRESKIKRENKIGGRAQLLRMRGNNKSLRGKLGMKNARGESYRTEGDTNILARGAEGDPASQKL